MIKQSEWGTRNVNKYFYESETRRIAALNEIFGDVELTVAEMRTLVWLAGWDEYTIENVLSAIRKAVAVEAKRLATATPSVGRKSSRQSAKAAFDGRNGCQKCFCVTFDESNKAYAPYPALIARKGRKDID